MVGQPEKSGRAFGSTLAGYLGQPSAPTALANTARKLPLAVTRVWTNGKKISETQSIPPEDAFHVILQRFDLPSHELWSHHQLIHTEPYPRHSISILDLRSEPRTRIQSAHEALVFYIPRSALNEIASDYGTPSIDGLRLRPGVAQLDPVMARLGIALLPSLEASSDLSQLLIDEFMLLMHAHVAQVYGNTQVVRVGARGGLAPGQERRAKELMSASIDLPLSLADIARECSLSVSHFTRAFRQTTGVPPHRWLVQHRTEAAKAMLLAGELSIAQIALACGFAEQSSFTKTFTRVVGTTPAAWRRLRQL